MKNSIKRTAKKVRDQLYIDFNLDDGAPIFLAGTGRSGTSWVANIINYKNEYRYIFEPFHPHNVNLCRKFRYRQYLRPENQDIDFIKPAKAILAGKIRNSWIDSKNRKFISRKRFIKDIRANLLLKWIQANFHGVRIILLIRHPCAVDNSRVKLNWGSHLGEFLAQKELMEDFLNPFRVAIEEAQSIFEQQIFLWCIENYVPLKQFNKHEIHLAFYENFCKDPKSEIDRLFGFLGKKFDNTALLNLQKPYVVREESAIISGDNLINSWKQYITGEQVEKAIEILGLFGLDKIYSEDSSPCVNAAYVTMSKT